MAKQIYELELAGRRLRFAFLHAGTRWLFRPFPRRSEATVADVAADEAWFEKARALLPEEPRETYVEFRSLIGLTGRALLHVDCCLFHAVSFVWRGRAWLLAAPSGVGKTTQYMNWQRLFPGEITMISGDMPVLERRGDGSVWVHPSPWNGKERIGNRIKAPLGGIVLLEQGPENRIETLSAGEALAPLFRQFIVPLDTEEEVLALCALLDRMLRSAPVFRFVNRGDDASTALLRETLACAAGKEEP